MSAIIGIDLGTTTSEIAYLKDGVPNVIKDRMAGTEITPSIVGLDERTKDLKVGKNAESYLTDVVMEIKRRMGERIKVKLGSEEYSPEEISAMILKKLKTYGEEYLNEEITEAVITVPANFPVEARKATEIAAELAGLKVLRIIQEPTAAALAFGFDKSINEEKVLVYDLGGGTFDVSVVDIVDGVIDVIAHDGDRHLGGADFDERIVQYLIEYINKEYNFFDIDEKLNYRIKNAAKKAKEELSFSSLTNINLPFFGIVDNQPFNVEVDLLRAKFDQLTSDLISRTISCTESALKSGRLNKTDISRVLLVGGSTRMPIVREKLSEFFGFEPSVDVEPDIAVSLGAALQAGIIKGATDTIIMDRVTYGFGVRSLELHGEQVLPDRYSEIIPPQAQMNKDYGHTFSTIHPDQEFVEVICFQREPNNSSKNIQDMIPIGVPTSIEVKPSPTGELLDIDIKMQYNLNGVIEVRATLPVTGEVKKWEIETASGDNAAKHQEGQKKRLEDLWHTSKHAEKTKSLINAVESRIDQMSDDDKKQAASLLEELKLSLVNEDEVLIEELTDKITEILINY